MQIYLTTSESPIYVDSTPVPDMYQCLIWTERPVRRQTLSYLAGGNDGCVWAASSKPHCNQSPATLPLVHIEDLAALGFPPPGKMRVVELGEYREEE